MLLICYSKCTTCLKAKKWLIANEFKFDERDIRGENPCCEELKKWHEKSGLPLTRFFNTSGKRYKELNLKDKLKIMSDEEMFQLLDEDGMLVKRPLLIAGDTVLVGFKEKEWETLLRAKK